VVRERPLNRMLFRPMDTTRAPAASRARRARRFSRRRRDLASARRRFPGSRQPGLQSQVASAVVNQDLLHASDVFFGRRASPKNIIWRSRQPPGPFDPQFPHGPASPTGCRPLNSPTARWPAGVYRTIQPVAASCRSQPQEHSAISIESSRFDPSRPRRVQRCLNCRLQTVFEAKLCIECDACIQSVRPTPDHHRNGDDRAVDRLKAPAQPQTAYVSEPLRQRPPQCQGRDLCVHCGSARALPDGAWTCRSPRSPAPRGPTTHGQPQKRQTA